MTYQSVKGTKDILPTESGAWQYLEGEIRAMAALYRYEEMRTPIFEETTVFARSIGEETDIVSKEMYTFADKGGSMLTLRPEMTAPIMRAYLQHALGERQLLTKVYYIGPMFRQERPQAGRFRQFHQFGFESIGQMAPACDAEIISLAAHLYDRLGIHYTLRINSVGDPSCRPAYREALSAFLEGVFDRLTPDSQRRARTNPMRVLDSKSEQDQEATRDAPLMLDYLSESAREHFNDVRSMLEALEVPYTVEPRLVRGLDYYCLTAFEFTSADLGSQDALGGGGRYDGLAEQLGGKPVPAVGFAAGLERLLMALEKKGFSVPSSVPDAYVIGLDDESRKLAFGLIARLRRAGISADGDFASRSFKAQMREANKTGARYALIIGEEERKSGKVALKEMSTGAQQTVSLEALVPALATALAGSGQAAEGH